MSVTTKAPGDIVTATIFNTKLEAPIQTDEVDTGSITSPKLATGAVTALKIARQPICQVKRTNDSTALVSSATTVITWESAAINSDNMWVIGSPTKITINTAGIYVMRITGAFEAIASGIRQLKIRVNNLTDIWLAQNATLGTGFATVIDGGTIYPLSANDYVEAYAFEDSGSNVKLVAVTDWAPVFTVYRAFS